MLNLFSFAFVDTAWLEACPQIAVPPVASLHPLTVGIGPLLIVLFPLAFGRGVSRNPHFGLVWFLLGLLSTLVPSPCASMAFASCLGVYFASSPSLEEGWDNWASYLLD